MIGTWHCNNVEHESSKLSLYTLVIAYKYIREHVWICGINVMIVYVPPILCV